MQRRIGVGTLRDLSPLGGQPAKTGGMVEGFAHLDGRTARPFPQFHEQGIKQRRVVIAEMSGHLWRRQWVEPDEMRGEPLGERRGQIGAFARRRLGIEHDQQILVAHRRLSRHRAGYTAEYPRKLSRSRIPQAEPLVAEQFHARLWPNYATRLSGMEWLW